MPAPLSRTLFRRERVSVWRRWWWYPLLALVVGIAAIGGFASWATSPIGLGGKASVELYVPEGAGLRTVSTQLVRSGASIPELPFLLLARLTRNERSLRVGVYEIRAGMSPWEVLQHLRRGRVVQSSLIIPDGWTFAQIRRRIEANQYLRHEINGLDDAEILRRIGATEPSLEGLLFPDNYFFDRQSSDLELVKRAYQAAKKRLDDA